MNKKSQAVNGRAIATQIITRWIKTGVFPDHLLQDVSINRSLVMEIVLGTIRQYRSLDWVRSHYVPRKPAPPLEAVLLVGIYQLLFMDNKADYATVHETVETAKKMLDQKSGNLVNAVLRRIQREDPVVILKKLNQQKIGVRLSHPEILINRWTHTFGRNETIKLCEWNNQRPEVILRINTARTSVEKCSTVFSQQEIHAEPHPRAPDFFLTLPRGVRVSELPGYEEGWFQVQDPSTRIATELLEAKPGETVLDACAAPGGKTAILAEQMKGEGTLVAADIAETRLHTTERNLERLGWEKTRFVIADFTNRDTVLQNLKTAELPTTFDAILLDVPCTNTGVIRRRPDARWRFSIERLHTVRTTQSAILDVASTLLAEEGRMVYSTCSLEPEENRQQMERWINKNKTFELVNSYALFPPEAGTDGAYAALIKRKT